MRFFWIFLFLFCLGCGEPEPLSKQDFDALEEAYYHLIASPSPSAIPIPETEDKTENTSSNEESFPTPSPSSTNTSKNPYPTPAPTPKVIVTLKWATPELGLVACGYSQRLQSCSVSKQVTQKELAELQLTYTQCSWQQSTQSLYIASCNFCPTTQVEQCYDNINKKYGKNIYYCIFPKHVSKYGCDWYYPASF